MPWTKWGSMARKNNKSDTARHQERLRNALALGLAFGLTARGQLATADPASSESSGWLSDAWWQKHDWHDDAEKRKFQKWLISQLRETTNHVILSPLYILDQQAGIMDDVLFPEGRDAEYRSRFFNFGWPETGLSIRSAAESVGFPCAEEDATERFRGHLVDLMDYLDTGWLIATGRQRSYEARRTVIPKVAWQSLHLGSWQDEVAKNNHGLIYYDVKIHRTLEEAREAEEIDRTGFLYELDDRRPLTVVQVVHDVVEKFLLNPTTRPRGISLPPLADAIAWTRLIIEISQRRLGSRRWEVTFDEKYIREDVLGDTEWWNRIKAQLQKEKVGKTRRLPVKQALSPGRPTSSDFLESQGTVSKATEKCTCRRTLIRPHLSGLPAISAM
jgi:hypothetical protein